MRLAGFTTRAHLLLRHSFPLENARRAFCQLVAIYLALGFEGGILESTIHRLTSRYAKALAPPFVSSLVSAIRKTDVWTIHTMGC